MSSTDRPKGTRARAPKAYDSRRYPSFAVTVDVVILSIHLEELSVLLVRRSDDPYAGHWALPGGFKRPDETLDQAARRELHEETGMHAPDHLGQLKAYGDPGRDPRTNVVSVAYLAVVRDIGTIRAGGDAEDAALFPVSQALHARTKLAFDHRQILEDAVERARADLEHTSLATAFVGPTFTLSQLRSVYETVWDTKLDPANFRRSLLSSDLDFVEATGTTAPPGPEGGRPPELYRATRSWEDAGSPVKRSRRRDPRDRR